MATAVFLTVGWRDLARGLGAKANALVLRVVSHVAAYSYVPALGRTALILIVGWGEVLLGRGGDDGALQCAQDATRFNAAFDGAFALHAEQAVFTVW